MEKLEIQNQDYFAYQDKQIQAMKAKFSKTTKNTKNSAQTIPSPVKTEEKRDGLDLSQEAYLLSGFRNFSTSKKPVFKLTYDKFGKMF